MSGIRDKEKLALLLLLLWLLRPKEQVTAGISFPPAPEGSCYDPETDSYYVGDC